MYSATYHCNAEAVHGLVGQYGPFLQEMPVQDKLFLRAALSLYQYKRFLVEENEQETIFSFKYSLDEAIEATDSDSSHLIPKTVDWLLLFVVDEEENKRSDLFEAFLKVLNEAIGQHL
jgi:hypothetical protein